ncbi:carboxypeptidase-like regulatory domain-containing protein [Paraburkholderia sp. DHOC27]|uniref:carboxypeptidase-like regulatory domain-containing protein n=1 Tax=Paraburkholderia sp. DHOC27 TaxID=2303330 RepID=UPI0011C0FC58|nr:carboxypeptidase-like regulatory domain-containing protein [Paraburkholderia sp. DHOC27]
MTKRGGGVVTCAGRPVFLSPDSPYFREIATIAVSGSKPDFPHGPGGPEDVVRHTTCDAQGNFGFGHLPDGNYILLASVRWTVDDRPQGGPMWLPGSVSGGTPRRVILSNGVFEANRASH